MQIGKKIRMKRISSRNTGRTIIVPMDHGVSVGPIPGLVDMREAIGGADEGGANAVVMHKGLVRTVHGGRGSDVGLILHLSASTSLSPYPNAKTLVASVEDALKLGADGVSFHVNLGDETERHMLAELGRVTSTAADWGMPVLAMVYARGPRIGNEYDPGVVAHCARVGTELGADMVKVPYTGDIESFSRVVDGCGIPVVIAGGPKLANTLDLVRMVHDSIQAGGAGLSIGRNIFQAEKPSLVIRALHGVVHQGWEVGRAMELIEG
jgi:class I fructose-bisphosphate aldolase